MCGKSRFDPPPTPPKRGVGARAGLGSEILIVDILVTSFLFCLAPLLGGVGGGLAPLLGGVGGGLVPLQERAIALLVKAQKLKSLC